MARISAVDSYERHRQILSLASQGLGQKAIAKQLGLSRGSVRHYLSRSLPPISPASLCDAALELKRQRPDFGPSQVLDNLALRFGFDRSSPPISESSLSSLFASCNLQRRQINHRGSNKPAYWLCNFDRPLRAFQIDTVKLVLDGGQQIEVFTCVDVVSRAIWAEVLPKDGSLSYCLSRCFRALGIPEIITTDNGRGFNLYTRARLSEIVQFAFASGVRQFHFIPIASPWHNSLIERFHRTMKSGSWLHAGRDCCQLESDVSFWLNDFLRYYNTIKSHGALGGKRSRTTPSAIHGSYNHLSVAPHDFHFSGQLPYSSGMVSYTRRVDSRGFARVDAPVMLFDLRLPAAFGRMARFELDVMSGLGRAYLFLRDDEPSEMTCIGSFQHELGSCVRTDGYIPIVLDSSFQVGDLEPRPFDEQLELERQRKHLRKGRRLPLPADYSYCELPDGGWCVVDKYLRVVTTSQHRIVDHLDEVLGDGWGRSE